MYRNTYFHFTDDEIFFDERKKRFIYMKSSRLLDQREYKGKFFKSQRPDYFGTDRSEFKENVKRGQILATSIMFQSRQEMRRLWRTMGGQGFQYYKPLMDDYFRAYVVDQPRTNRLWTWQDSTRLAEFYKLHLKKAEKYGLDLPHTTKVYKTKEELKQREDELVEYFLHEMRKQPVE